MAHPAKKDVELPRDLVGPMQLMEELAQSPETKGSTPIPSKATMLFVSSMSAVAKKDLDGALKKVRFSCAIFFLAGSFAGGVFAPPARLCAP